MWQNCTCIFIFQRFSNKDFFFFPMLFLPQSTCWKFNTTSLPWSLSLTVSQQHNVLKLSPGFGYRVYNHITNRGLFSTTDRHQFCFYYTDTHTHTRTKKKQITNITIVHRSTVNLCSWHSSFSKCNKPLKNTPHVSCVCIVFIAGSCWLLVTLTSHSLTSQQNANLMLVINFGINNLLKYFWYIYMTLFGM